ncbi:MAG TPA: RsmE family RNA methyltransferase [Bryobacteraceae bacterium]|nr:RsmE family RNA methyltransferase [Bryobacteraceae bacterium]
MARRRFFVPAVESGTAELLDEEARHLTQVLRVETGEEYEISDNEHVYVAEVEQARKARVLFRVLERLPDAPQGPNLTLLLSLIKFERLETALEKATELGVTEVRLVRAERSEKGLEVAAGKRMPRWRRIMLEASQQSRRDRLPVLSGPVSFVQALRTEATHRIWLDEDRTGASMLNAISGFSSAALFIGPEGGWTGSERESAKDAGWTTVSLGPFVLRAETAATAALAVLSSAFLHHGTMRDSAEKRL